MRLFDLLAIQRDASSSSSAIVFKANYMRDESGNRVHENTIGAMATGKALAEFMKSYVPLDPVLFASAVGVSADGRLPTLANPIFAATSGGTSNTGVSGAIPASWRIVRIGSTGSLVSAVQGRGDGGGNEVVLDATFTAAGEEFQIKQELPIADWNTGDVLQGLAEMIVESGATGLAGAYLHLEVSTNAGTVSAMDAFADAAHGPDLGDAQLRQLATPLLTVPANTSKTYATLIGRFVSVGAGSARIRIRSAQVRKKAA